MLSLLAGVVQLQLEAQTTVLDSLEEFNDQGRLLVLTLLLALPALRLGFIWDDLVHRQELAHAGPGDAAMDLWRFVDPAGMQDSGMRQFLPWGTHGWSTRFSLNSQNPKGSASRWRFPKRRRLERPMHLI